MNEDISILNVGDRVAVACCDSHIETKNFASPIRGVLLARQTAEECSVGERRESLELDME